ncbi:MAG: hypothetical protein ACXAEF_01880 [Candidatus Thorarchaeota archaeon]|jgi:hypothetical protein
MSDDLVTDFFEYLITTHENEKNQLEKPLFLMAALKYVLKNNLHGISFNEILYKSHTRHIRELFLRCARSRINSPEATWRTMTNPRNPEMQKQTREYIASHGDVSAAFSELKPFRMRNLIDAFEERLDNLA